MSEQLHGGGCPQQPPRQPSEACGSHSRSTRGGVARGLAAIVAVFTLASVALVAQMPDLRRMAGQPLPSGDLPAGSISVRVVRQTIANNVSGVVVELVSGDGAIGGAVAKSLTTDGSGRAVFPDAPAGATLRAVTTVDGERLVSQPFSVPTSGGLRILLAAGLGAAAGPSGEAASAAPAQPAAPGSIVLGGQSRMVLELAEGSIEVFCLVDVLNPAGHAVTLTSPIVFEAPAGATNATLLEGSSPLARVEGSHATIAGPLPAGTTSLQFAYRVPIQGPALRVRQVLPLAATQLTVIVRKMGDLSVTLASERARRDAPIEGRTYLVLNSGAVAAGGAVELGLEGLPSHPRWPRYLALGLAALVVAIGVWSLVGGQSPESRDAERLRADRADRFNELVALERKLAKKASPGPEQAERRARLIEEIVEQDLAIAAEGATGSSAREGDADETVSTGARASAVQ
jgi:hypothetical protein